MLIQIRQVCGPKKEEIPTEERDQETPEHHVRPIGRRLRLGGGVRRLLRAVLGGRAGQVLRRALRRGHGDLQGLIRLGRVLDTSDSDVPMSSAW